MKTTQVKDLMETQLEVISPEASIIDAARKMKEKDCGFLPVGSQDSPEGIITDRDIVIRVLAEGRDPATTKVQDCMTPEVCACKEGDRLEDAAEIMSEKNVSRLVVRDSKERVCGVLSFGHVIRNNDNKRETSNVVETATARAA